MCSFSPYTVQKKPAGLSPGGLSIGIEAVFDRETGAYSSFACVSPFTNASFSMRALSVALSASR